MLAVFLGVTLVAMNELFTTRVRYGGFSIGYNISVSAFGGTAPFLVTLLIQATGSNLAPAYYIMAAAAITLAVVLTAHETAPVRGGGRRGPRGGRGSAGLVAGQQRSLGVAQVVLQQPTAPARSPERTWSAISTLRARNASWKASVSSIRAYASRNSPSTCATRASRRALPASADQRLVEADAGGRHGLPVGPGRRGLAVGQRLAQPAQALGPQRLDLGERPALDHPADLVEVGDVLPGQLRGRRRRG